jgi:hypothetical protein
VLRAAGVEALRQGNFSIVEFSYQKTKSYERLSFLYLIAGATDKLRKMLKIAEMRHDVMSRFHNALYLGDVREQVRRWAWCRHGQPTRSAVVAPPPHAALGDAREVTGGCDNDVVVAVVCQVRILEEAGQLPLAFVAASTHGLADEAERLAGKMGGELPELAPPRGGPPSLLAPPTPVLREENWPLLTVSKVGGGEQGEAGRGRTGGGELGGDVRPGRAGRGCRSVAHGAGVSWAAARGVLNVRLARPRASLALLCRAGLLRDACSQGRGQCGGGGRGRGGGGGQRQGRCCCGGGHGDRRERAGGRGLGRRRPGAGRCALGPGGALRAAACAAGLSHRRAGVRFGTHV